MPKRDAATLAQVAGALAESDDLLRRLAEWDMMSPSAVIPLADAPYWLGQIENTRTLNRLALQAVKDA